MATGDSLDSAAGRRPSGHSPQRQLTIVLGCVLVALVLIGGAVAVGYLARARPAGTPESVAVVVAGPIADKEGVFWDHKELTRHLGNKTGLAWKFKDTNEGLLYGPSAYLYVAEESEENRVRCQKRPTPRQAKDDAGVAEDGFSWGCFVFKCGDAKRLKLIHDALN